MSLKTPDILMLAAGFLGGILAAFVWFPFWRELPLSAPNNLCNTQSARVVFTSLASSEVNASQDSEPGLQIRFPAELHGAGTIWIPAELAHRLSYFSAGHFSNSFKLQPEAIAILGIDQATQIKIEAASDAFLAQIRKLEVQAAQYLEQTDDTIVVKIPSGFAPAALKQEISDRLQEYLGQERADLFTKLYFRGISDVTSAFQDGDCIIRVKLEGERQSFTEMRQPNHTMSFGGLPDFLQHLIKLQENKE